MLCWHDYGGRHICEVVFLCGGLKLTVVHKEPALCATTWESIKWRSIKKCGLSRSVFEDWEEPTVLGWDHRAYLATPAPWQDLLVRVQVYVLQPYELKMRVSNVEFCPGEQNNIVLLPSCLFFFFLWDAQSSFLWTSRGLPCRIQSIPECQTLHNNVLRSAGKVVLHWNLLCYFNKRNPLGALKLDTNNNCVQAKNGFCYT